MKTIKSVEQGVLTVIDHSRGNDQAEFLLTLFKKHLDGWVNYAVNTHKKGGRVEIEPFTNCRERGYTIKRSFNVQENSKPVGIGTGCKTRYVSFAEHRSSDSIVVYPFEWGGKTCEDDYKTKSRYFNCYDFAGALDFILTHLELTPDDIKVIKDDEETPDA